MAKPRGRDQARALQRMVQILSLLANAGSDGVSREVLLRQVDLGAKHDKDRIDVLQREVRYLKKLGWQISVDRDNEGELTRWYLDDQDPRLTSIFREDELAQLTRAAHKAGREPGTLGLPRYVGGGTPQFPVEIRSAGVFVLDELMHALQYRCLVQFTYDGKRHEVELDQIRQTHQGKWIIVGRADGSDKQRQFEMDRIVSRPDHGAPRSFRYESRAPDSLVVDVPGSAGQAHPDLTELEPLNTPDGPQIDAEVATTAEFEPLVIGTLGVPIERTESEAEIVLKIPVINHYLWRQGLYRLATRVRLLGPDCLREEVRADLSQFLVESQP